MTKDLLIKKITNESLKKIARGIGLAKYPPQYTPPKRIVITFGEGVISNK
ncbi:hypothetical protein [Anaerovibrio sp. RM50]|nr:hypothetical protein [Anaerovibrio sp. RM50]